MPSAIRMSLTPADMTALLRRLSLGTRFDKSDERMCKLGFCLSVEMINEWSTLTDTNIDLNFVTSLAHRYSTHVVIYGLDYRLSHALWDLAAMAQSLNRFLYAYPDMGRLDAEASYQAVSSMQHGEYTSPKPMPIERHAYLFV